MGSGIILGKITILEDRCTNQHPTLRDAAQFAQLFSSAAVLVAFMDKSLRLDKPKPKYKYNIYIYALIARCLLRHT